MKFILLVFLVLSFQQTALSKDCIYTLKKDTAKVTWTGFKFTDKKGVSGTFDKIKVQAAPSTTLKRLYRSLSFEIDTKSVNSGNPARDATLKKSVFGFLKIPNTIKGKTESASSSKIDMNVTLNEKTPIQLLVTASEGKIQAKGVLNLLGNGLKKSYDAVHKACEGLHTGSDGVSKTWSDVELLVEAEYSTDCSSTFMGKIKSFFGQ